MSKETEEIVIFAGVALLVMMMLSNGGLGSAAATTAAKLQAQTDQTYANDASDVLTSIFD